MIEKMGESAGNVIGFKCVGTVRKEDYDVMVPEVEALLEQGDVRLLVDMEEYDWLEAKAWGTDMKFGREIDKGVSKFAIVGDKKWQKWLAPMAEPFLAGDVEYFTTEDRDKAWAWLRA